MRTMQRLTRRQLVQVGGIGVLGLGLPELLRAGAGPGSNAPRRRADKSCIFIVQYGGASHIDSWDMKPAAPKEVRGEFSPIATSAPGVTVCEHLPHLGDLRLPPPSIRHLHASTLSGSLGGFIALAPSRGHVGILHNPRSQAEAARL